MNKSGDNRSHEHEGQEGTRNTRYLQFLKRRREIELELELELERQQSAMQEAQEKASKFFAFYFGKSNKSPIEAPPGFRLRKLVEIVCPPSFRKRELEALHADALQLYFDHLQAGELKEARRVKWAMHGWILWAVFGGLIGSALTLLIGKKKSSN